MGRSIAVSPYGMPVFVAHKVAIQGSPCPYIATCCRLRGILPAHPDDVYRGEIDVFIVEPGTWPTVQYVPNVPHMREAGENGAWAYPFENSDFMDFARDKYGPHMLDELHRRWFDMNLGCAADVAAALRKAGVNV